jgi:putative MATE family efflux protein
MILKLAWPVAAEMAMQTLTQVIDMTMVSRLGPAAVAAIGLSFRPLFFVMSIFLGIGAGTTALVARAMGSRDPATAQRVAHQVLLATVLLASFLGLGVYSLAPGIQRFMGAAEEVIPLGTQYIRSLSWGLVFMYTSMVATAALRGAGDTRTSMKANIVSNILNVLLNYTLIFGHFGFPRLGVLGAGIATSIARCVGASIILLLLFKGRLVIKMPNTGLLRFQPEIFVRVVKVGVPAAMERILLSTAMILHLRMVAVCGTMAVAAATLAQNIEELSHMPSIGLSVAASALVGQFLGYDDPDSAQRSGWEAMRMALVFMGSMGVLFALFPGTWLMIYSPDPGVIPLSRALVRIMGISQPFMAIGFVLAGALRGAGDTRSVMAITAASMWAVRLSLTYVFMFVLHWGAEGAWYAMLIDTFIRAGLTVYVFKRGRWRSVKV